MSDGVPPIPTPIGPATSSMHARPASATCSKSSAQKRCDTFTIFGDGWEHTIKVERLVDRELGALYPRLIEASGRCPPEDVGGPWGYAEFLEAINDPKHESHAHFAEWFADDFDPNLVGSEGLAEEVAVLAKRWSRKPANKRMRRT
jgi:Plasmid pRiA4b ORF-3-like protein